MMTADNSNTVLNGKCALVTGSARRIGASIAQRLHREGAAVAIHYRRSANEAAALVAELNSDGYGNARAFRADLDNLDELRKLVHEVAGWKSAIDILVNNASAFYPTPIGSITEIQWDDLIGSNLKAPLFLSQEALPYLRQGCGTIVNIVDIHGQKPLRNHSLYGAAKAGLTMLTLSLAKDLAPDVRVNAVAPGAIMWPEDGMTAAVKQGIVERIPLDRQGSPDDIAGAVLYLVSEATYVTGQVLAVDGGRSIGW